MAKTRDALPADRDRKRDGLRIRRRFTTEGVHPYDPLTWERRDAVITNWRDGTVAFEQRDVEFPATWSLNATNIVAQKYFRGPLGTPRRERSVRQMIDRVAGTIADWGIKDRYFATDGDAEAFRAELTHILVNQLAAFNSPVWFNVGVEALPQCSACQPYDALVSTPTGMVPIGELVEREAIGTVVYDAHGETRVRAVKYNGEKQVFRVRLRNGSFIEATGDHLVYAVQERRTQGAWHRVDQLMPGMRLHMYPHRASQDDVVGRLSAESTQVSEVGGGATTAVRIEPGTAKEIAEAALAGWLQADGSVGQYNGTDKSLTIEFMTMTQEEYDWVQQHVQAVFPDVHQHVRVVETDDSNLVGRRIRLYGNVLRPFVDAWDLRPRRHDLRVPSRLWNAPNEVVAAYLRSVFQADGFINKRGETVARIGLGVISERWTEDLQILLLRLGIYSRRLEKLDPRPDRSNLWELTIGMRSERRTFAGKVGFISAAKATKLAASSEFDGKSCPDLREEEVLAVDDRGMQPVYDIQTDSGEYLSNNIRVHNCFILSVADTMPSILNWYVEEGMIFKGGSGSGINLSTIRSSKEQLANGGEASGPVSFMRGADASAGTIKSGGKTRRAAKMVVLNVDHPDVRDFIWCKAREEHKARVLRDSGFDMDLDGHDAYSIQYQNANNSVRVTDEFMRAYEADATFDLKAVVDGSTVDTVRARDLMRDIAQAAWECADPGMQYDTTINDWHTAPESGRINASNPCFTGEMRVHTDKGLIRFDELLARAATGETFGIYTHDATNPDAPTESVTLSSHETVMVTGTNPVVRLRFSHGAEIRCTPNHRFWTANRGWVAAEDLTPDDRVRLLDQPTPASAAEWLLPVSTEVAVYATKGDHSAPMELPVKWDEDFAHLLGWLVGDGAFSGNVISAVYGSDEDRAVMLPRHQRLFMRLNGGRTPKVSVQSNGTMQLRLSRRALAAFFEELGLKRVKAADKDVPWSVFEAPTEIVGAFLRGLFDADGTVVKRQANGSRYVGLGSSSNGLLRSVQILLSSVGIHSRIYKLSNGGRSTFTYTTQAGVARSYDSNALYDLRIACEGIDRFAELVGFALPSKAKRLEAIVGTSESRKGCVATLVDCALDGFEVTYNLTEPRNYSYIVEGSIVANCSEYMHLDNSACNLASLNLLKFLDENGKFDVEAYKHAVEIVFLAQEIIVGNSSYPTEKIDRNAKAYRQLGLGYANLGALLMALGKGYDSDGGRAWAGALTALMTGHAYRTSARVAEVMGPFAGYPPNRDPMLQVMRKHRRAVDDVEADLVQPDLMEVARTAWDEAIASGQEHGYRNAQASVLAPTGCLTPETLVTTDRGLVRLGQLGDPDGTRWQDLDVDVATDEGPRRATRFFVNGHAATKRVETVSGYEIQGTPEHRVKVVDESTGAWMWRRLTEVRPGDLLPLQLGELVGSPRTVALPTLGDAYWTGEQNLRAPATVTPELAELVGYFMGDGSLHAKGLRFCVANTDPDVVEHLRILGKSLFGLEAHVTSQTGYQEVAFHSIRLALWWEACGFAKGSPAAGHSGKGWEPYVPAALLEANDPDVYGAFLRGLFEADGSVTTNTPSLSTASARLATDVSTMLLALGIPTTTRRTESGWGTKRMSQVRIRNLEFVSPFNELVGFISERKAHACANVRIVQAGNRDRIALPRAVWDELVPVGHRLRNDVLQSLRRHGCVSRSLAKAVLRETGDLRLEVALGYIYERVTLNEDGGVQPTFDLSVPDNVTYVANGFISHNTISFLMDCDTTGIEPDLALIKYKKLVGGGSMAIVNQTVPRALRTLGYAEEHVQAIVEYVAEHNSVKGAPALREEHYEVFDCAMGDSPIHYTGHLRMMAAVQPFISGAISKTVNLPESVTVEDVEQAFVEGWRLGLKAVAIYRDNCKVAQPLSADRKGDKGTDVVHTDTGVDIQIDQAPVRTRLPKRRPSTTTSFRISDLEGYITAGSYPDGGLGEIFVKVSKQGSTLSGVMDAFAIAVSIGLQYGVPLETFTSKFTNMIFEPNGLTDDPDIRFAQSIVDYLFRRLAIDHLDEETRHALGVRTTAERTAALDATAGAPPAGAPPAAGAPQAPAPAEGPAAGSAAGPADQGPERQADAGDAGGAPAARAGSLAFSAGTAAVDAPYCSTCGVRMRPAGSCFVCESCGTTSGCS
jgi:ribonucleoside-diphosphate reductase alpha chain